MEIIKIEYPDISKLTEYQKEYICLIPSGMHLLEALEFSYRGLFKTIKNISEESSIFTYQPYKWSIKTVILHISDTEKVFQYRALSISRGVRENLISFDENEFAANSNADLLSFKKIVEDFSLTAMSLQCQFENLREDSFNKLGKANNQILSAAIIGFMTAGHRLHHLNTLKERYLIE